MDIIKRKQTPYDVTRNFLFYCDRRHQVVLASNLVEGTALSDVSAYLLLSVIAAVTDDVKESLTPLFTVQNSVCPFELGAQALC
jgi:hypothetical protein